MKIRYYKDVKKADEWIMFERNNTFKIGSVINTPIYVSVFKSTFSLPDLEQKGKRASLADKEKDDTVEKSNLTEVKVGFKASNGKSHTPKSNKPSPKSNKPSLKKNHSSVGANYQIGDDESYKFRPFVNIQLDLKRSVATKYLRF